MTYDFFSTYQFKNLIQENRNTIDFFLIHSDKERSLQMSRATSPQSVIVGRPPTNATLVARFCRERAPRTCEHALLRRSRACARTESFLSKGDSLTLELKLTQGTALK